MRADDLSAPAGGSFKFDNVGDSLAGTIAFVGDWESRISKYTGNPEQICRIGVDVGNADVAYIYPKRGSIMAGALADAMRAAGLAELTPGQDLKLTYYESKDTGKGNPAKLFDASISAAGVTPVGRQDTEPF